MRRLDWKTDGERLAVRAIVTDGMIGIRVMRSVVVTRRRMIIQNDLCR